MSAQTHFAVIGAGMAGITCARTLQQAGHRVSLFEQSDVVGGRMGHVQTSFGSFDYGAQYFTVRDSRFAQSLATTPALCKPWSANAVRVLDDRGRLVEAALPNPEAHWVPIKGMGILLQAWAVPLQHMHLHRRVVAIERDPMQAQKWQLRTHLPDGGLHVEAGFDRVILALPHGPAQSLLAQSENVRSSSKWGLEAVQIAPCSVLFLAFPQASQPGFSSLGPQWNAARSTHHRIAWLARESSKPGRHSLERWTVQASPDWSAEHINDDAMRVIAKMSKAFAEVTGIRTEPAFADTYRWYQAKTLKALGRPYIWDAQQGIGLCGDWCLGHRVEDAFLSGLELALAAL